MQRAISAPAGQPVPLWFRFATSLPYVRYRLTGWLQGRSVLDRLVSVPFHDRHVVVPLVESARGWRHNLGSYQIRRVARFAAMCDGAMGKFDFIDCGGHFGLISVQFAAHSYGVRQLTLIEPNRAVFPLAEANVRGVRAEHVRCINAALSDFEGRGRLVAPEYSAATDALFLVPDPAGDVDVITLSSVLRDCRSPNLAIKVDIEGQEAKVLCAARDELRAFEKVVLIVELHKKVLDRIGVSGVRMMEEIDGIRPLRWVRAQNGAPVDPHRPIFEQVGRTQCDLIGVSK